MNGRVRSVLIAASVLVLSAASAQAGFQWTAPAPSAAAPGNSNARPPEMAPRSAAAPVTPVMSESLASGQSIQAGAPIATMPDGPASAAPIYGQGMTNDPVTWNAPMQQQQRSRNNEVYVPRAPQTNGMPQPIVAQAPAPVSGSIDGYSNLLSPMNNSQYEVAQGFGRDLPLVMAIRQIVPPRYGFVFDQNIDVQQHISWQGGAPWDIVLQNTLAPMGMQATINGNVISISRTGGLQMASMNGPSVATQTIQTNTTTTMTPAPAMISAAPAPMAPMAMPAVIDDMTAPAYAAPAAAGRPDLLANSTWTAPRNSTLRSILEDWSKRADVELYWASEYDYPVQSGVSLNGTFEEAVQVLLKGLYDSKPRPMGRLHPNLPNGPAVLVIETRQNSM